jgi:[ribosomal protein S5]-alanine N-acetyltransferase
MEFETLETERLFLKIVTPEIYTHLFEHHSEAGIKKLLGLTSDEDFIREKLKSRGGYTTYDRTVLSFLLVLKDTNETIGKSGFHNWYKDHRKAEVGYILYKEEVKRKGYMTEALKTILDYGFNVMNLNRIEACISPSNLASQNLIKKYGFKQEGVLRQHYIREGEIQDSLIYSLLNEEYKIS